MQYIKFYPYPCIRHGSRSKEKASNPRSHAASVFFVRVFCASRLWGIYSDTRLSSRCIRSPSNRVKIDTSTLTENQENIQHRDSLNRHLPLQTDVLGNKLARYYKWVRVAVVGPQPADVLTYSPSHEAIGLI
ncbi:hypothetical protein EVAR_11268_1 [Eumeta japonica]|uniref:Uncharacterized protein n=1 Tax=Eumeta variegata TaxID=151549 RepID=A0A4C1UKN7_EUMVA|nr:hypothetical protein EVAR_11268_1 [Eumeta japonica]